MKSKTVILASMLMITTYASAFSGPGSGTETDPYIITTLQQLQEMRDDLLASYVLVNDIDASATSDWNGGAGFIPIGSGSNNNYFRGHFNGNGHVITGLYINRPNSGKVGLFGHMTGGCIVENVGLINARIFGRYNVGTLVGVCSGNSLIDNCWVSGQVTISSDGSNEAKSGGLIGELKSSVLSQSYSNVAVTALSSREQVGGLCGYLRGRSGTPNAIIENCYSMSTVTANGYKVGGLVGDADGVNALVSKCYSVGKVNGLRKKGLVGYNFRNPTIRDSYWDLQASGCSSSVGGAGRTTAQMMQQNTFAGWDFVGVWWIDEGVDYPKLWRETSSNTAPVADAGDDIFAYAGPDGMATVTLDGTGSVDADGDELEYFWFNDADKLIAEGVDPNVVFAAGVHVIELVVDDGTVSSEPNSVVVTVIEAIEAVARVFPRVLNTTSRGRYVIARMELPDGVTKDDVADDSLVLIIGDVTIGTIRQQGIASGGQDYIFGFFDRGEVIAQAYGKTKLDIVIAGELTTGQCVYGEDSIKIVKSQASQKKTLRRMPVRNSRGGRRGR